MAETTGIKPNQNERRETWAELNRRTKGLAGVAFEHALKYELPYSPGLDMDAIYRNPRFQKGAGVTDNVTITINLDKLCAECRKPGAAGSGLCIRCVTRAMNQKRKMWSAEGRSVQRRLAAHWEKVKRG